MRKIVFASFVALLMIACGSDGDKNASASNTAPPKSMVPDAPKDDGKGFGEVKNVTLNNPLDQDMIDKGKAIYEMKCSACHKLKSKRLVGPGFRGVTDRRKPEWIMNMITNVEIMLDKDPAAQKLLEECLTRMPNQNVSTEDSRAILEFLLSNDAPK